MVAERPLWRTRDFMLLWSGQVVSTLGSRISALAFPLLVLAISGSPAQAGLVGFAQGLPFLVWYLPAGALVDRWSRKRVMLAADAGRSPGDFANRLSISAVSRGGAFGFRSDTGTAGTVATACNTAATESPAKGNVPVIIRYSTQPMLNRSER